MAHFQPYRHLCLVSTHYELPALIEVNRMQRVPTIVSHEHLP
jgi:hypothetical protein